MELFQAEHLSLLLFLLLVLLLLGNRSEHEIVVARVVHVCLLAGLA